MLFNIILFIGGNLAGSGRGFSELISESQVADSPASPGRFRELVVHAIFRRDVIA